MRHSRFSGRTVVVTGGTRGIGRMIAQGFATQGADVIICARTAADCRQVAGEVETDVSGSCIGIAGDLSRADEIRRVGGIVAEHGRAVHTLVNTVAMHPSKKDWSENDQVEHDWETIGEDDWDATIDLTLRTSFLMTQALLPLLTVGATQAWPASIINIGAAEGYRPADGGDYAYAAAKAGLHHLTHTLAKKLGSRLLTVNAIVPGNFSAATTQDHSNDRATAVPRRRTGRAADIAGLATYLASDAAGFLTGATIPLDGGASLV